MEKEKERKLSKLIVLYQIIQPILKTLHNYKRLEPNWNHRTDVKKKKK
jgi:hypothetical protein